jgi:predicted small lipoprotein YifL
MISAPRMTSVLALAALFAGCGLKGALYLPEERAQEVSSQSGEQDEQEKKPRSTSPAPAGEVQAPAVPTDTTRPPPPPVSPPPPPRD